MAGYRILRTIGRLALRWYYRDIEVLGLERIPKSGPALLASNHPNALVDALVIACTLRRPVTLTAKATLLDHAITRALLRMVGVVPLHRVADAVQADRPDPARNVRAFTAVLDVLSRGGLVLVFPEGKSHTDSALAPLRTGIARMAVMARANRNLDVPIIPIGLTFERKWEPRSRVLMHVGVPITVGRLEPDVPNGVAPIMHAVLAGLREVTLNFRTTDEARRVLSVSTTLAEVLDEFRPLHTPDPPLVESVRLAQRINTVVPQLAGLHPNVAVRVDRFLTRFDEFEALTRNNGIAASDVQMTTKFRSGVWFAIRELCIGAVAGPLAIWGRVNHWAPLRIARSLASKRSRAPDEPAMNTIVAGLVLVLLFCAIQIAIVARWVGWLAAVAYAISLPLSATWDFRYTDRVHRATARVRTYLRFRRQPVLHERLRGELAWLRSEAIALNHLLGERTQGRVAGTAPSHMR